MSDCTKENCPLVDPGNCGVETCKWKTGGYSMSDLISRQAAIDTLEKILPADPMRNDYTQGITCGVALAMEYIKQLPPTVI